MQSPKLTTLCLCSATLGAMAFVGCGSAPGGSRQPALYDQPRQPAADKGARGPFAAEDPADAGQDDIQLLIGRLESLELDNAQLKKQLSDQYMQAVAERRAKLEAEKKAPATNSVQPKETDPQQGTASPTAKPANLSEASRLDLLEALVAQINKSDEPARVKALTAAALSVASPTHALDPALLDKLDPRSREQVARFHQMLAVAYDELAGDREKELTRREMFEKIDEVFGAQPLQIETLQLCRRVDSYGVYKPFATNRFLSGRKNRVLIYVELENFHHEPTADGEFEVRLEQQVELYDATGDATVWRQGPVELVDVSRNKRRDFFIVYPIDLPARLTAGAYRLKVRVADKHTGSMSEQTLHDIQIVADKALVAGE